MEFAGKAPALHLAVERHFGLPEGLAAIGRNAIKSRSVQAGGNSSPAFRQPMASVFSGSSVRFLTTAGWCIRWEWVGALPFAINFHDLFFWGVGGGDSSAGEPGLVDHFPWRFAPRPDQPSVTGCGAGETRGSRTVEKKDGGIFTGAKYQRFREQDG